MTTSNAMDTKALRQTLSSTQAEFAQLVGNAVATVARWEEKRAKPEPGTVRKLQRLRQVVDELQGVIEPAHIPGWLSTPHVDLDHHAPMEVLDSDLGLEQILQVIQAIKWGNYS